MENENEKIDTVFYIDQPSTYKYLFSFQFFREELPDSVIKTKKRRAWRLLAVYLFFIIAFKIYIEWHTYHYPVLYDDGCWPFLQALVFIIIFMVILISLLSLLRRRAYSPIIIYVIGLSVLMAVHFYIDSAEMSMRIKGHFFAKYPQFCQHSPSLNKKMSICYSYEWAYDSSMKEFIIFDFDDEFSKPLAQWTDHSLHYFMIENPDSSFYEEEKKCIFQNMKLITNHVYWLHYDCYY